MSDLFIALASAIITSGLLIIGYIILNSRRAGVQDVPWEKIRPILVYVFAKIVELSEKEKMGYEAMESFAIDLVYEQIQSADLFTKEEKDLFTKDLIRTLLKSKLKTLYDDNKAP
jgi:hypothetical protein